MTENLVIVTENIEQMQFKTQAQLDKCLAKWQKILRLQDWEIRAALVHAQDIEGNQGCCDVHFKLKSATIRIANDVAPLLDSLWSVDQEQTLVHELLHIHFHASEPKSGGQKFELFEQAIDTLATCLVVQDRR